MEKKKILEYKESWKKKLKLIDAHIEAIPKFGDNLNKYLETENSDKKRSIERRHKL